MISLFGNTTGFGLPAMLAAIPFVVGLLVYIYRRQGTGKKEFIGTLLFLKDLARPIITRKRFVPPPRFFFELLLLLLLILGAADIFVRQQDNRVALIIDNSFSLFQRPDGKEDGETLFSRAKELAQLELDVLSSGTMVEVYATSPYFRSLTGGLSGIRAAANAIDSLLPAYAADNLEVAVSRLAGDPRFENIYVFTDRNRSLTTASETGEIDTRFRFIGLVQGITPLRANLAISSILAARKDDRVSIRAHLSHYGNKEVEIEALLSVLSESDSTLKILERKKVQISGGEETEVLFDLQNQNYRAFSLRIVPGTSAIDVIPEDNEVYVSPGSAKKPLVVISNFDAAGLGLDGLSAARFDVVDPLRYEKEAETYSDRTLIFHRVAPAELPKSDALFIMPPEGSTFAAGAVLQEEIPVTRWESSHLLLSYLNVPALTPQALVPLKVPPWGINVVNTSRGSLLVAGEFEGNRYAATGIELLPFKGGEDPAVSVLTLNLLKWLDQGTFSAGYVTPGSTVPLESGITSVRYLSGENLPVLNENELKVVSPSTTGLLEFSGRDARTVAVSYFNSSESNVVENEPIALPARHYDTSQREESGGIGHYLAWLLVLLIIGDILLTTRLFGRYGKTAAAALEVRNGG